MLKTKYQVQVQVADLNEESGKNWYGWAGCDLLDTKAEAEEQVRTARTTGWDKDRVRYQMVCVDDAPQASENQTEVIHYESIAAMIGAADAAFQAGHCHKNDPRHVCRASFVGRRFASWDECKSLANQDWPAGEMILDNITRKLACLDLPKPVTRRRKARFDENDGDEVDHDRLRNGDAYWRRVQRANATGIQTISLFAAVSGSAALSSEDLMWRGAAMVVLADMLEQAGYRCEMYAVRCNENAFRNGDGILQTVRLKRADQPLDKSTLVNAIAGWFYRTIWFQSQYAVRPEQASASMGRRESLELKRGLLQQLAGNQTLIFDDLFTAAQAREVVEKEIAFLNSTAS